MLCSCLLELYVQSLINYVSVLVLELELLPSLSSVYGESFNIRVCNGIYVYMLYMCLYRDMCTCGSGVLSYWYGQCPLLADYHTSNIADSNIDL